MTRVNASPIEHLAFENGTGGKAPPELWRVSCLRGVPNHEPLRHINYFASKADAEQHADWLEQRGATDIDVAYYTRGDGEKT